MHVIRIASRGSQLSLIQVKTVIEVLRNFVNDEFEVKIIKTRGDADTHRPLYEMGGKGLFEAEVNLAVLRGEADIAVHSLKDIPAQISDGLELAMVTERQDPRDAIISIKGYSLDTLPSKARIGTSSLRRRGFALAVRSDLQVEPIRGNVDTRLRKLLSREFDALIMAVAGINRIGADNIDIVPIPPSQMPPAPGQGIIGVVARSDNPLIPILHRASHRETEIEAMAERAFLEEAGAGCHVPLGGLASVSGDRLSFTAGIVEPNGGNRLIITGSAPLSEATELGRKMARLVLDEARRRGLNLY
ncbi:MAG: hydroxymethylbilane synthase [Thermocladium sp.]